MTKTAIRGTMMFVRRDGIGFLIGRVLMVDNRHGHDVYTIKTLGGNLISISANDYDAQPY
jgi:hypothetical protein